jgi:hypothetical protein
VSGVGLSGGQFGHSGFLFHESNIARFRLQRKGVNRTMVVRVTEPVVGSSRPGLTLLLLLLVFVLFHNVINNVRVCNQV